MALNGGASVASEFRQSSSFRGFLNKWSVSAGPVCKTESSNLIKRVAVPLTEVELAREVDDSTGALDGTVDEPGAEVGAGEEVGAGAEAGAEADAEAAGRRLRGRLRVVVLVRRMKAHAKLYELV